MLLGQTLLTVGGKLIVMAVALFLSYILLKEAKDPRAAGQTVNWLMYFFEAFVWLLQFGLIAVYVLTVSQIRNAAVSYSRRKK